MSSEARTLRERSSRSCAASSGLSGALSILHIMQSQLWMLHCAAVSTVRMQGVQVPIFSKFPLIATESSEHHVQPSIRPHDTAVRLDAPPPRRVGERLEADIGGGGVAQRDRDAPAGRRALGQQLGDRRLAADGGLARGHGELQPGRFGAVSGAVSTF